MPVIECRAMPVDALPIAAELRAEMEREFGFDYDQDRSGWRERFCEFYGDRQRTGRGQLFLAFDGAEPIGMTLISLTDEWRSHCFGLRFGFINAVFVRPQYRRRGIARELMSRAIDWAREQGCVRVRLRTSEEGRALYEGLGFGAGREMELEL